MPGKVVTKKINHVTTMVKDTARAMKFYNDLVGIKQIQSQVDNPAIDSTPMDFTGAMSFIGCAPVPPPGPPQ